MRATGMRFGTAALLAALWACGGTGSVTPDNGDPGPGAADAPDASPECAVKEDCPPRACQVAVCVAGACDYRAGLEGAECAPDGRCFAGPGTCAGGACVASPKACGERACQVGACDPATGDCAWTPVPTGTTCDDDDPCTTDDRCDGGACAGTVDPACECGSDADCPAKLPDRCKGPAVCDPVEHRCRQDPATAVVCDGAGRDPCNPLACEPATGECVAQARPDGEECRPDDPCLRVGTCGGAACETGPRCPDTVCAVRRCDGEGPCVVVEVRNNGAACDDGDPCTLDDVCAEGACAGTPNPCDDGNACTNDRCTPAGCVQDAAAADGGACDDGRACTAGDVCAGGTCAGTPGTEACNGVDDDCDDDVDEPDALDCRPFFVDGDGDAWGAGEPRCLCAATGAWVAAAGGDCDDGDPRYHPEAAEVCNDLDEDCDGDPRDEGGEGCLEFNRDADGDGHGVYPAEPRCLCLPVGEWTATDQLDCDDADPAVRPGVDDPCDGVDNDCSGWTDEDDMPYRCGKGVCDHVETVCVDGVHHDCDPLLGAGDEACNRLDDDCDGDVDEDLGLQTCGVGACERSLPNCLDGTRPACVPGQPGAEACNGLDDDCEGTMDPPDSLGCVPWYLDQDGDGWGAAESRCLCGPDGSYTTKVTGDCFDQDPNVRPGLNSCGIDADCNGKLPDPQEPCDDGNAAAWDGCDGCAAVEFVVNGYTAGDQAAPVAAFHLDGTGGFVVAWAGVGCGDPLCLNTDSGIFLRRFTDEGVAVGGDVHVNAYTAGIQDRPSIAARSDRTFVVAWNSGGQVRLQRFDEEAGRVGAEIRADVDGTASALDVAALEDGGFVVAWTEPDGDGGGIRARRYGADGLPLAAPAWAHTVFVGDQDRPRVAANADGALGMAWSATASDGTASALVRRFTAAGLATGPEAAIATLGGAAVDRPDLAARFFGGSFAAWRDAGTAVRVRGFLADGTPAAGEGTANDIGGTVGTPSVAASSAGGVAAWRVEQPGGGILARRLNAIGEAVGDPIVVSTSGAPTGDPHVSATLDGRFLVTWAAQGPDGSGWGVVARRFDGAGNPLYR